VKFLDGGFEELTIDEFHDGLRRGDLTARQLIDWYLEQIQRHDTSGVEIQAVVTVNPRARDEAAEADHFFASTGEFLGSLHGVPVLVKDQAETVDLRTTFGSVLFEHYVPESDATVIAKLKAAGAIVLAKTTMCDFAMGWFSSSSLTGHTKNPYDLTRDSGGSSAGAAAGVAANFGLVGVGEDTGGSIRIPASFNNLFGLRVTTGLISRSGLSPLLHLQDTPGPIGRTVSDVAKVLDCIVGYDDKDPYTVAALGAPALGGYSQALSVNVSFNSWRIGVLESGFEAGENLDADPVNQVVRGTIADLAALGVCTIPALEIEDLDKWITDTSLYAKQSKSDITAFLKSRPNAPVSSFAEIYASKQFHPLNDLFHLVAEGPDLVDGDAEYLGLRMNQERFRRLILNIFASHGLDFLVYPTVRVVAPTRNELASVENSVTNFPTNTVIGSQSGLPALTIPVGFTVDGLPVGMELLGPPLGESKMLQFAYSLETCSRTRRPPQLDPRPVSSVQA
jgi:amidase